MTQATWDQLKNNKKYRKGMNGWKELNNYMESLNGSRTMYHDGANLNLWAAIVLLRHEDLDIWDKIWDLDSKTEISKEDISELFDKIKELNKKLDNTTAYVKDRVDLAGDYMLDCIESSVTPRTVSAHQLAKEATQPQSSEALNSGVNLSTELTSRQQEVLALKKQGKTNVEIAKSLCISEPRITQLMQIITKKTQNLG